ncbi:lysophospholipid acyltransferase family protein [Anaplasma capra]|uniref:lysophospholipid acyltransferase family protein n=1 Tax=Anaplasma capra TaxID=1562740 RepID=UPI0021D58F80|nr:lysophospholipid acyltransferase family protein [Anaplasma capra]
MAHEVFVVAEVSILQFYILSTIFSILVACLTLPLLPFMPMSYRRAVGVFWARAILYLCRVIDGISYEVVGKEHLPDGPFIVASEHQSPMETLILYAELKNVVFVLKKELKVFPLLGVYFTALGMVFIDRNNKVSAARKVARESAVKANEGCTLVIFPEGTTRMSRASPERALKRGVAVVYSQTSLPVVPIVLNTGNYWPSDIVLLNKRPGKATIKILPAIEPGLGLEEFMGRLYHCYEQNRID